jgi:hypothetical protein
MGTFPLNLSSNYQPLLLHFITLHAFHFAITGTHVADATAVSPTVLKKKNAIREKRCTKLIEIVSVLSCHSRSRMPILLANAPDWLSVRCTTQANLVAYVL